jgi:hypothetical protein
LLLNVIIASFPTNLKLLPVPLNGILVREENSPAIHRCQPDLPGTTALATIEREALYMRIHKSTTLPGTVPIAYQAIRWIAQLGGFLGRKSDGEPGIVTLWRGWQRLQDFAATWELVKGQPQLG